MFLQCEKDDKSFMKIPQKCSEQYFHYLSVFLLLQNLFETGCIYDNIATISLIS